MRTAQEIGDFLKQLRKEADVNQTVIAQRCGITQKTWSRLEHGQQSLTLDLLHKLVTGIPINPIMLLGLEDDVTDLQSQKRTSLPISSELGP
jgi:transcriptional regulator with XRE-family HTH domain